MTREQIISSLKADIIEEYEVDESVITPDAPIYETLELDSLSLVDLVSIVHHKFGIMIPKDEIKSIRTFNDLYDYIEARMK